MEEKYSSPQKQHDFYNKDGSGGGIKGVRPPVPAILDDTSTSDNILSHKRKNLPSSSSSSSYDGDDDDDSSDDGIADDGFSFAVKEVSLVEEGYHAKQSIFQLRQEISLMSQFKHENIVRYFGTNKENNMLYIFFELVTKESLASLYQKFPLRDSQVSEYTRQILSGLKYLHDQNVVHGDLKCANILVDASDSLKLSGFGLAKAIKLNDVRSSKGSPYWMAPEVVNLRNRGYGLAADIWSLGCTVLEMLTRQPPYSHLKGMQALFRIGKGQPPSVPESLSKDARDFILKCLQVNPSKRPTSAQLLSHPFVKRPLLFPRRISRVNLLEYFYYDVT
ncbi:hypothetical protein RIF29_41693 [Crotalaria pallida]|uniref:Protein kinase domain-containing protein n=1 Tax=Crotalaria pallida TaxID=3830 RepID=A0AAN9E5J8_CROPI